MIELDLSAKQQAQIIVAAGAALRGDFTAEVHGDVRVTVLGDAPLSKINALVLKEVRSRIKEARDVLAALPKDIAAVMVSKAERDAARDEIGDPGLFFEKGVH